MTLIRKMIIAVLLLCAGSVSAASFGDYQSDQERMMIINIGNSSNFFLVSSFDLKDHITAYTENGQLLWDLTFYPKILSWKIHNGYLYVFSKSRSLDNTYLTCVDPITGKIMWERP